MISDRPYRRAMTLDAVIAELRQCAGTQFDPALVEVFIRIADRERDTLFVNTGQQVMQRSDPLRQMIGRRDLPLDAVRALRDEISTVQSGCEEGSSECRAPQATS